MVRARTAALAALLACLGTDAAQTPCPTGAQCKTRPNGNKYQVKTFIPFRVLPIALAGTVVAVVHLRADSASLCVGVPMASI